ncbi:hypothetical protein P154DRAFT_571056 [Amniculicola lignicola CBS 123094]|uniref:Uncharacterized protein n=1 Tax=Amniculicola lignicola CBS 123094 TaxID=1392246 RepID=A0A6A5WVX4_9PLEO|nr:hypothetical protein P154DRAFT_571056 [Amniculicola lignicola CBS 123094]
MPPIFRSALTLGAFLGTPVRSFWFTGPKVYGILRQKYPHHYYFGPNAERWAKLYDETAKDSTTSTSKFADRSGSTSKAEVTTRKLATSPFAITTRVWLDPQLDITGKVWPRQVHDGSETASAHPDGLRLAPKPIQRTRRILRRT